MTGIAISKCHFVDDTIVRTSEIVLASQIQTGTAIHNPQIREIEVRAKVKVEQHIENIPHLPVALVRQVLGASL